MAWVGNWQNQFGSILRITSDAEGRIEGNFETALEDSGFYGQSVPVIGFHRGNCIGFVAVRCIAEFPSRHEARYSEARYSPEAAR
ncbi:MULTISPECIES: avidin/streptavidin family protein [unclassified Bradyrhizobium]|uniref:avidin/streptavidin family protein n=1 Tax=unclassified Bradyrhizobium TaxID=2631580 RepID=UPI001FF7B6E4|nr:MULTISPECIES: avidin/streptavidin family protein [unclassified Bradyrhizobium]MCK1714309.1 hypothetical protein [Bradyrhizobium sp. 143]MCK1726919.1 hypothetical protein [Bradyrhizobium sp. 142]